MGNNKSRLGRGLGGLITGTGSSQKSEKPSAAVKKVAKSADTQDSKSKESTRSKTKIAEGTTEFRELPIISIDANPFQPRREFEENALADLAESIKRQGLLQPVVVRAEQDRFQLIAGERRLRAFKKLGRDIIPARVITSNDASAATLALIENLQREDLNPIDEALGFASLVRDFDLTQEVAAERVGKARATVANALRLLTFGTEIQGYLSRRMISVGHAKVLLGLANSEQQRLLARRIVETGMSVREAESEVKRLRNEKANSSKNHAKSTSEDIVIRDLEKRIGAHFNSKVAIKHGAKKGKLTIEYLGNDDLERILTKLGISAD